MNQILPSMPFIDVRAQRVRLGKDIEEAIGRVLAHCQFSMGPEVFEFERALAQFCGAKFALSCGSGTDALLIVLMAKGIGPGDAVLCPTFTFCATAEVVALAGAIPLMIDVEEATFNVDVDSLRQGIVQAKRLGLKPRAVIPVDLFGQPADFDAINAIAGDEGMFVLDDAAQAFGATYKGRRIGTLAPATATSFFPAKPLACYGDGGAVLTDDVELVNIMKSIRVHGQGSDKYDNVRIGVNGRLDTIQAAVLLEKLNIFAEEIEARDRIASRYSAQLADVVSVPRVADGSRSVWAQYTVRVPDGRRDELALALQARGVPTAIYYPRPLHRQTAYSHFPIASNGLPVSERLATEVLSLPMHPYLTEANQDRVITAVREVLGGD